MNYYKDNLKVTTDKTCRNCKLSKWWYPNYLRCNYAMMKTGSNCEPVCFEPLSVNRDLNTNWTILDFFDTLYIPNCTTPYWGQTPSPDYVHIFTNGRND